MNQIAKFILMVHAQAVLVAAQGFDVIFAAAHGG
jgi:hypothetical protein